MQCSEKKNKYCVKERLFIETLILTRIASIGWKGGNI